MADADAGADLLGNEGVQLLNAPGIRKISGASSCEKAKPDESYPRLFEGLEPFDQVMAQLLDPDCSDDSAHSTAP
jgi:hypothetical protein